MTVLHVAYEAFVVEHECPAADDVAEVVEVLRMGLVVEVLRMGLVVEVLHMGLGGAGGEWDR